MRTRRSLPTLMAVLVVGAVTAGCGATAGPPMSGTAYQGHRTSRLTCTAPASLPGTRVSIVLRDMGMSRMMGGDAPLGSPMMLRAVPASVPAGEISFVVGNLGWRTHELVVMPLAPGRSVGQRVPDSNGEVDETGSLGEASASCAGGTGDGIEAGTSGWLSLDLPPGRYELLCNLRNHYANGMYQLLTVS